jgi:hypothetical protein
VAYLKEYLDDSGLGLREPNTSLRESGILFEIWAVYGSRNKYGSALFLQSSDTSSVSDVDRYVFIRQL